MTRSRAPWLAVFALAVLVAEAAPVRADLAGPWPWSRTQRPIRPLHNPDPPIPPPNMEEPAPPKVAETPAPPPKPEMWPDDPIPKPKRSGPFRSCGSGTPAALAGISAMWAMLWLGNRFARSSRSPAPRSPSARG